MFCLTTYTLEHVAFTLWVERWNSRRSWIVFVFRRKCYSQYVLINRRIDFVCYWIVGDRICWHRQTHINIHIVKLMNIFYCVFSKFIFICMWTKTNEFVDSFTNSISARKGIKTKVSLSNLPKTRWKMRQRLSTKYWFFIRLTTENMFIPSIDYLSIVCIQIVSLFDLLRSLFFF